MPSKRILLTKSKIEKAQCPPSKKEHRLHDSLVPNLIVRIFPSGYRTFDYRYRPHGGGRRVNPRMLKIGAYPSIGLDDARRAALVFAGAVARGEDPAQQRAEERRKSRATLNKLLAVDGPYERHLKERGLVNVKPALSALRRGLKEHMATDVAVLSRANIVSAIDALSRIGKRGAADDLRKFANGLFDWTTAKGLTPHNPLAGLRMPGRTRQQRLRDEQKGKALSDAEIFALWRAAQALADRAGAGEAVSGTFGGLVQLALLTGMRRGELLQLERDRHILTGERAVTARGIDGERIHLPKTITKTAADHDIPLTAMMRAVIAAQPKTTSLLLFPSRKTGGRMRGSAHLVTALQREAGVDFLLHDLRRTTRTLMSRLGVSEDVSEMAIGHQRESLILKYNKDPMWAQRVAAFEKVSAHIASLLADTGDDRSNVIAMPARTPTPAG
jgi:integrase